MEKYVNKFTKENFAEMISLDAFQEYEKSFSEISSNSSLRKIYDTYLDFYKKYYEKNELEDFEIEKEIWFAKIAYQEQRGLLPSKTRNNKKQETYDNSFTKFLREIYNKIDDAKKFKQFLEVLIAYHKFFNPKSK